jgi:RNA polymerase sigma-70 factor (ECF subfamily)
MAGDITHADIIEWLSFCILPHEASLRGWLRRHSSGMDEDDLIQEAYCRLSQLQDWRSIANPRAYLFTTVRNLMLEHVRRNQVVGIYSLLDINSVELVDQAPSPETVLLDRDELSRLNDIAAHLPDSCRDVFILRKLHQLPQREVADRLNITQNVVEKRAAQALQLVLKAWTKPRKPQKTSFPEPHARSSK